MKSTRIAVIIPAYRSKLTILDVIEQIPEFVDLIVVVDDACPESTGRHVEANVQDQRVRVLHLQNNQGVGGATMEGFREALEERIDIFVKIDSDGQMNPLDITRVIAPIRSLKADYAKGNRFNSPEDLQEMPKIRVFGNAMLSLMSKFSTGYWSVNDPTNGFIAISRGALESIDLDKIRKRWFFESDLLFRLAIVRAKVIDVPIRARYGGEKSNLQISKVLGEFFLGHVVNFHKRIFYSYYIREWSIVSFELPASIILSLVGVALGVNFWVQGSETGDGATSGQVMLSVLPIILGFQLLLSALSFDVSNEPKQANFLSYKDRASD